MLITLKELKSIEWIAKSDLIMGMHSTSSEDTFAECTFEEGGAECTFKEAELSTFRETKLNAFREAERSKDEKDAECTFAEQDDDEQIDIQDNIKIIPDCLTNENIIDVFKAMNFFGGEPSTFLNYVRSRPHKELDNLLKEYKDEPEENEVRKLQEFNFIEDDCLCYWAGRNGHLKYLKYCYLNNYKWNEHLIDCIVESGSLECLMYAIENGCPYYKNYHHVYNAKCNLKCLEYLLEKGCHWDASVTYSYTINGNLELLEYAVNNGCQLHWNLIEVAARTGHIKIIEWLEQKGYTVNEDTIVSAVEGGQLECVKYLHRRGCSLSVDAIYKAISFNYFNCFEYLLDNGCPFNDVVTIAVRHNRLKFLKYLHQHGYNWSIHTTNEAISHGNLKCLKYLVDNGCPVGDVNLINIYHKSQQQCVEYIRSKITEYEVRSSNLKVIIRNIAITFLMIVLTVFYSTKFYADHMSASKST